MAAIPEKTTELTEPTGAFVDAGLCDAPSPRLASSELVAVANRGTLVQCRLSDEQMKGRCRSGLILIGLWVASFTLATKLHWAFDTRESQSSTSLMESLMAETRTLMANHVLTKADIYLHSGFYPSVFDQARSERRSHLSEEAATGNHQEITSESGDDDELSWTPNKPLDCIEAFAQNLLPSKHTHLDESGNQREVLPWLSLAAELDPHNVEIYTVAGYWLRSHMGKAREAEELLRAGWRANPGSGEILFELGRLFQDNHRDPNRARNLFEAALRRLDRSRPPLSEEQLYLLRQITARLARLEREEGHPEKALEYLTRLRQLSPNPRPIQEQIDELKAKMHLAGTTPQ